MQQEVLELILKKEYDLVPINKRGELNYFYAALVIKTFRSNSFNATHRIKDKQVSHDMVDRFFNETDWKDENHNINFNASTFNYILCNDEENRIALEKEKTREYIIGKIEKPSYATAYEMYDAKLIQWYYKGESCPEIAHKTGIPERTIYHDIKRIKGNLKEEYDKIINHK